ncbi:PiggyBac transposable element-derived protein 4 [Fusarium austroafricanum]|uniref:PiggyBac transposable element-derived protein 4 n=1 Tax=Fusarium austroafricanum TaxID=2364996 RepID=A0A8H4KDV0_9HYPO|nr:PiggyBac transposable element-derived protein 4 [Fusarium austroafricanum]
MTSQSVPIETQATAAYGDTSFSSQYPASRSGPPNLPAEESCGHNFQPFNVPFRKFKITYLPQTPLELFQLFIPSSYVYRWIDYTNSWVSHLIENGVVDNWDRPLEQTSRILDWDGLSSSQVYIWLGMLIYLGIHRENAIEDHWNTPRPGVHSPFHLITKFMPLRKFELITCYLRLFDYSKYLHIDLNDIPKVFQVVDEWSNHIQCMSALLFQPGSSVAVDECMIRYTGRSKDTTLVRNKPTPLGFKVWVIAQEGFFINWMWYIKGSQVSLYGVERQRRKGGKGKNSLDDFELLSNTQRVVVVLCDRLPIQTYHVFLDNLFSSTALFALLRKHSYGATGTARPNCGIRKDLQLAKLQDKSGKSGFIFNEFRVITSPDNLVGS